MTVHARPRPRSDVHTIVRICMYQPPGRLYRDGVCRRTNKLRSLCKVIKPWYGCVVPDQVMLVDLYHQYASGHLDSSTEVSAELVTTCDNRSKIKFKIPPAALTMVSGADENVVIYFMWPYFLYICHC